MSATFHGFQGRNFPFQPATPLPLHGFPSGKYKIRLRPGEFVKIYIKTPEGIRLFIAEEKDGKWTPGVEVARNIHGHHGNDWRPE